MFIRKIEHFFKRFLLAGWSAQKLALSCCLGIYIAFSPFIFLHTIMVFFFSWLFSLNGIVTLTVSYAVNNPWTMVPIYAADYFLGRWLLHNVCGLNLLNINPGWMNSLNDQLAYHIGISGISFWAFMLGGNLLGFVISGILYPIMKHIFEKLAIKTQSDNQ